MLHLLWLIPALPLAGFLVLATVGGRFTRRVVATIGVGSVTLSALVSLLAASVFLTAAPVGGAFSQRLWTWINLGTLTPAIGFYLDPLSLVMTVVVTVVGSLIHVYSAESMKSDEGYSRFFAYMNLFVAAMVILLLADNLLLLYLGWEGVGLCSYLLIGFWYKDPLNGLAARKAFIVTRVGDTSMILGLFLLFAQLGTLDIQGLMARATSQWSVGSPLAIAAAALLLGGALGKSAQLPLQTWLPDAMAGPTPTSALIHAATMVTAGVYLIARTHTLFTLAPVVQTTVAVIGAATLLVAGCSALVQSDIKRVLAYSTISQIGYMFVALGVGAWSAAIFHFMTHAFFKALLFLAAGLVIEALDDEHSLFKMGGLRRELPVAFWAFVIGGASLAGLPLVTAGFFSKGLIVWTAWTAERGSPWLWLAAVLGVLLTALYTSRLIFLAFFGPTRTRPAHRAGALMTVPVIVLCVLSVVGGWVELPPWLGNLPAFSRLISGSLPATVEMHRGAMSEPLSELILLLVLALGVVCAYGLFLRRRDLSEAWASGALSRRVHRLWLTDWGMDWLYDRVLVRPLVFFARIDKDDVVDRIYTGLATVTELGWRIVRTTENGQVRWYAAGIALGAVAAIAAVLIL